MFAVADRVISKKHKILGSSVQVTKLTEKVEDETDERSLFELNRLVVTTSASVRPDLLSIYFSTALDLEEEDFTLSVNDTTCLVTFSSAYTQTGKFAFYCSYELKFQFHVSQSWKGCAIRLVARS